MEEFLPVQVESIEDQPWIVEIFDNLEDIFFYIKDVNGRWVTCNNASLRLLNFSSRTEVYGAVEHDFFPREIADAIKADDQKVLQNCRKIINRTEMIVDEHGLLTWVSTNKIPLRKKDGSIFGLMGTTRKLKQLDDLPIDYRPFHKVMEHIRENLDKTIKINVLAEISCLSESQFRKRFRRLFRLSPQEFIQRARLQRAAKLLSSTDLALVDVALAAGYGGQSYFTKQFHAFFGMTPKRYRQVWQVAKFD